MKQLSLVSSSAMIKHQIKKVIHRWKDFILSKSKVVAIKPPTTKPSDAPDSGKIQYIDKEPELRSLTKKERDEIKEKERQWQLLVVSSVSSPNPQHPPTFPRARAADAPVPASLRLRKRNANTAELMGSTSLSHPATNRQPSNPKREASSTAQLKKKKPETQRSPPLSHPPSRSATSQKPSSSVAAGGRKNDREPGRRMLSESEESDSEMDDFIIDDVDDSKDIHSFIRQIFGNREYDESRDISFFLNLFSESFFNGREKPWKAPVLRLMQRKSTLELWARSRTALRCCSFCKRIILCLCLTKSCETTVHTYYCSARYMVGF